MSGAVEFPPNALRAVITEVTTLLQERNETVSVAETAAGGIISASILSTPGASRIFKGGLTNMMRLIACGITNCLIAPRVIALYASIKGAIRDRINTVTAGWTEATIKAYKGPTPEVVSGLAENVRGKLGSTYTICESGTAGPTGGSTPNRTPGYVALAVASEAGTFTRELSTGLGGDREKNMIAFAVEAVKLLRDVIKGQVKL